MRGSDIEAFGRNVEDGSDTAVDITGHVLRAGARPAVRLPGVAMACTRARVRIIEKGAVRWEGTARVAATPDGVVVMLPNPVERLAVGDRLRMLVAPTTRRSRVPDDIASVLRAHGLPIEQWEHPEVRHLVRWVAEATGELRRERLDLVGSALPRSVEARDGVYSEAFYETSGDVAHQAAVEIVPLLMASFRPRSVIDVGCGTGSFIEEFVRHGVADVVGVERPDLPADLYRGPDGSLRLRDLEQPLSLDRRFDLAVCLEVAEHLSPIRTEGLVRDLVELADVVVFSAAIPGQGGTHHVNEQWPQFWADQFGRHRFEAYDVLRPMIWTNPSIAWWYRQNLVVYARSTALPDGFTTEATALMPLVHPDLYEARNRYIAELERVSSGRMGEEAERLRLLLAAARAPAGPIVSSLETLFDTAWYLSTNPDVAAAGVDPLDHYATRGWRERRNPHPLFDTGWYLDTYPDVDYPTGNPLSHFVESGWREGRDPHPLFHTSTYLAEHADVAASGLDPLSHYVMFGAFEGRRA